MSSTLRRVAPAVGLFLLAPLVAEFLLGNLPLTMLPALIALAPLYGGGALLIREVVRRRGQGWPSLVLLTLAYGVLEEGLTTQSLFNPDYAGQRLLDYGFVPALGIGLPWTLYVLGLHTVWSISVPVATVELLTPERQTAPWLGRIGLAVTAALFAVGIAVTTAFNLATWPYRATTPQLLGAALVVVLLVAVALRLPPRAGAARGPAAPSGWLTGGFALLAGALFMLLSALPRSVPAAVAVLALLALYAAVTVAILVWSRRPGWGDAQRLGLVAGALLTYAWHAFPESPVVPTPPAVDLVGNAVFAAGAVLLIVLAARRLGHQPGPAARAPAPPVPAAPAGAGAGS